MNPMDATPPGAWWFSFLPLIIVGVVILGLIFLIVLGILISRRVTITLRASGAVALTLASILLLSGLWCMFLSPTTTYSDTKESFYRRVSIGGLENWSYSINIREGETLSGSVDGVRAFNGPTNALGKTFSVYVHDPDGNIVWSETNITYTHFNIAALKSGLYRVEVQNPNEDSIECYMHIAVSVEVTYRPLEPVGQLLSLISLPIFGLGIWASGALAAIQKGQRNKPKE